MKKLTLIFALLIGCVLAPLHSFVAFAGDIYQIFHNRPRKGEVFRFKEGDTVIYHMANGETKTFNLGKYIDEGDHGRVFDLLGTDPPDVIKFSKDDYPHFIKEEARSLQILKAQEVPHSEFRESDSDFYLVKKKIHGSTLFSLNEIFNKLSRTKRIETLKKLNSALQRLVQHLQKGPYGFEDIHPGNLIFDGKDLFVLDPMETNTDPKKTAKTLESTVRELSNLGPCLALVAEEPIWLERYFDLRESRGQPFLDSEKPAAAELRSAFLRGHAVPVIIQEQVILTAIHESFSPRFGDTIKPVLKSILERGEIEGHSTHRLMTLLLDRVETPSEIVELANLYSKKLSHKTRPTAFFFRKFVAGASWEDIQSVLHQVPPELKPLLIRSIADAAESSSALLRALSLPLNSNDVDDPEFLRLTIVRERFTKIERFGKEKGTPVLLDFRDQISPGASAQSQKVYESLYFRLTQEAIAQSKTTEEAIRCFDDAPSRLTPELRKKLTDLPTHLKAHLDTLGISRSDLQWLTKKFTSEPVNALLNCLLQNFIRTVKRQTKD